jgi:hypothetical protein
MNTLLGNLVDNKEPKKGSKAYRRWKKLNRRGAMSININCGTDLQEHLQDEKDVRKISLALKSTRIRQIDNSKSLWKLCQTEPDSIWRPQECAVLPQHMKLSMVFSLADTRCNHVSFLSLFGEEDKLQPTPFAVITWSTSQMPLIPILVPSGWWCWSRPPRADQKSAYCMHLTCCI